MRKLPVAIATAMKKAGVAKQRQSKYRAVPTVVDGIRFDSKAEAEYYKRLVVMRNREEIKYFLRQISFDIPGGYKHRVDFMTVATVVHVYGQVHIPIRDIKYIEIKGKDIGTGKMKRKQVEELYGIKIHVMRAKYRSGQIVSFEEVES